MKQHFGLYLILTDPAAGYEACAAAAVECGVRFLQLRMKDAPRAAVLQTAHRLAEITRGTGTHFIVNDDPEIAREVDADGIHLGQTDLDLDEARRRWNRPGKLYGLSTHSMAQAADAARLAPDYIGVGPVFPTPTKAHADPALGIAETARIIRSTPIPAVAIGGIDHNNLPELLRAGIRNFCVVRAVNDTADPAAAIRALQETCRRHAF